MTGNMYNAIHKRTRPFYCRRLIRLRDFIYGIAADGLTGSGQLRLKRLLHNAVKRHRDLVRRNTDQFKAVRN